MDYGRLIQDAWRITWRHPFLWVLGLFAGGTAGLSFGSGGGGGGGGRGGGGVPASSPDALPWSNLGVGPADVARWLSDNVGLIVAAVATLLLVGLALLVVSLIAQGGLARATADFAGGESSSLGRAWRSGRHSFWRFAGLWLLLIVVATLVGATVAGLAALVVWLASSVEQAAWVVAPAILVGLVLLVAGIAAGVVASIVVPFAQRAIAVRELGPLEALRDGWLLLREHPGASLLVWLIDLALNVAVALVITTATIAAVVALGIPAAALWAAFALTAPTVAYLVAAVVVVLGLLLTLTSMANAFSWSYWTLAYVRLRSAGPAAPAT